MNGLTAASPVLPSEDPAAFEDHRRHFFAEYQPATPTESQLVQERVDTSWRLNRIPLLEADLLARAANPPTEQAVSLSQEMEFDIVDAHRLLANVSKASASPASSRKPSTSSATSKPTAASASAATAKTPPACSNSINTKEFPGSRPIMASSENLIVTPCFQSVEVLGWTAAGTEATR